MPEGSTYAAEHIVVMVVFATIAITAVGLRLWARRIQKMSLSSNDYLILAGLVFTLAEVGYNLYSASRSPSPQNP